MVPTATTNLIHLVDLEECAKAYKEGLTMPVEWLMLDQEYAVYHQTRWPEEYGELWNWYRSLYAHMIDCEWSARLERCRKGGHDWVDTGYASPESGAMGAECKTCGVSCWEVLY